MEDIFAYLFFFGIILSFQVSLVVSGILTLVFLACHERVAMFIFLAFFVVGLLFRITNGFGIS